MKLSKQCIEAIEKEANDKALNDVHSKVMAAGMRLALTNTSIYSKAGLISLEDALGFAEWHLQTFDYTEKRGWQNKHITTDVAQLFQIYQEQKEKP